KRLPLLTGNTVGGISAVPATGGKDCRAALTAVRAVGPSAVPFLMGKLEGRPPSSRLGKALKRSLGNCAITRLVLPQLSPMDYEEERGQAVAGLVVLCPLPANAVQRLTALSVDFKGSAW